MKTLAIELKVASSTKQVTYLKHLTSFLVNVPSNGEGHEDIFSLVQKNLLESKIITSDDVKLENFMTSFIDHFEFRAPPVETPSWEFFDNNALNQILQQCQKKSTLKLIDLKKLHQILYDELKNLQGIRLLFNSFIINIFYIIFVVCRYSRHRPDPSNQPRDPQSPQVRPQSKQKGRSVRVRDRPGGLLETAGRGSGQFHALGNSGLQGTAGD